MYITICKIKNYKSKEIPGNTWKISIYFLAKKHEKPGKTWKLTKKTGKVVKSQGKSGKNVFKPQ